MFIFASKRWSSAKRGENLSFPKCLVSLLRFYCALRGAEKNFYFLFVHSSSECLEKRKENE